MVIFYFIHLSILHGRDCILTVWFWQVHRWSWRLSLSYCHCFFISFVLKLQRSLMKISILHYSLTCLPKYSDWRQRIQISGTLDKLRTDKPTKAPVVADNKQCNCPPSVVTYIRWGNSTCPYGADNIYSGVVAGSWFDHTGAAADPLCFTSWPTISFVSGWLSKLGTNIWSRVSNRWHSIRPQSWS